MYLQTTFKLSVKNSILNKVLYIKRMHKDHEKSPSGTYTTNTSTKESTTQPAKMNEVQ